MNALNQIIFSLFLLLFIYSDIIARELPNHESTANANDYALRKALLDGNIEEFGHYLSLGADPTEWLDYTHNGWVFCAATEVGREQYLRLLIDKGYDVNFHQVDIGSSISLPLTCAVSFDNLQALQMLVAGGADPTVAPSIEFPESAPTSVMSEAIIVGKYDLAVWLFDKGDYTDEQLKSDINMLQIFPVNESAPINKYRLKLAELFRQRGYEVDLWTRDQNAGK